MLRHIATPSGLTLAAAWVIFLAFAAFQIAEWYIGPAIFGSHAPVW